MSVSTSSAFMHSCRVPIFFIRLVRNPPRCCYFLLLPLYLFKMEDTGSVGDAVPLTYGADADHVLFSKNIVQPLGNFSLQFVLERLGSPSLYTSRHF